MPGLRLPKAPPPLWLIITCSVYVIDAITATPAPVIPAFSKRRHVAYARPIAEALVAGDLPALEVTLRTPIALEAIGEMAKVDGVVVGAGTVLNERDLDASLKAGAEFIVSPGLTDPLGKAAIASGDPLPAWYRYCGRHPAWPRSGT